MQRNGKRKPMLLPMRFKGLQNAFVSPVMFDVNEWKDDDPRIHKSANCRYRDQRTYLDIIHDLIKADMLESVLP